MWFWMMINGQWRGDEDEETGFHIHSSFVEVSSLWLDRSVERLQFGPLDQA